MREGKMSKRLQASVLGEEYPMESRFALNCLKAGLTAVLGFILMGCQTSNQPPAQASWPGTPEATQDKPHETAKADLIVLREGDTVRVTFPGAPTLNAVQQIRRDGRISLPLIGEFQAAGLTPPQMEQELLKQYGPQLQSKEVTVSVDSSAFPIYVTGAVLRPGKIMTDRPLTALEAIMDAGIDYNRANLKTVRVVRTENGQTKHYNLNLKDVLNGESENQFTLKPQDIVFVPEKFSWF
jgi:polysaccharide export outer membrane protein